MNLANPTPICKPPIPFPFAFATMDPVVTPVAIAFGPTAIIWAESETAIFFPSADEPEPSPHALAVEAQMAPRALYRAAQHPSARTAQITQWAAARAEAGRGAWVERARAVPIEAEARRRGLHLRRQGQELVGPCPVCRDGDDRFAINPKKQVWNVRTCCNTGGRDALSLVAFIDRLDLTAAEDFRRACETLTGEAGPSAPPLAKRGDYPGKPDIVETFGYTNENDELVYQRQRVEFIGEDGQRILKGSKPDKQFWQRRPDPNRPGKFINKIDGVERLPFRLPELLNDLSFERTVFVVEGERKANLLRSWGIPATCGTKDWPAYLSKHFKDADVVILPDNDKPGMDYANKVAASLVAVGARVRVLNLPGLDAKGDIVDWAEAGGTPEQFHALVDRDARPWVAPQGNGLDHDDLYIPPGDEAVLPAIPDPVTMSADAWLKRDIPPRDHLLGGVFSTTSRWFGYGKTGIGKTLYGMCMGGGMSKGQGFLNWAGQRPARVMYLDGELPVETFKERMQLIVARYGEGLPFYGYNRDDLGGVMPPLNTEEGQKWLWRVIDSLGPDAVFFELNYVAPRREFVRRGALETDASSCARALHSAHRATLVQSCKRLRKKLRHENARMGDGYRF